jgi:2-aminoethylphosphonate-pyruvate transaminase
MNSLNSLIKNKNKKILFTPVPSSLSKENIIGLGPFFGRGDKDYLSLEKIVLGFLKKMSGQKHVVPFQGSGSLAIEMMCYNFLNGKILIIDTGYYSERIIGICENLLELKRITSIKIVKWNKIEKFRGNYNWVIGCPTETSIGLCVPIKEIKKLANKVNAKLMLDATASIGLEKNHDYANVLSFSSCKGLFGLTGASFVSYSIKPRYFKKSFYMNLNNHENKKMTGPYHIMASLLNVLKNYDSFKKAVIKNKLYFVKKFKNNLIYPSKNQPMLCTYVNKKLKSINKNVILYKSRGKISGTVVSHLGEVHLKTKAKGKIINFLK